MVEDECVDFAVLFVASHGDGGYLSVFFEERLQIGFHFAVGELYR
jgi:hypothetical protein